ncbi:MAG: hypothetical protein IPH28_11710 [Cytophagaceae bacterium]|nr:hypothetical protein [Cytophagaceae bacterium]
MQKIGHKLFVPFVVFFVTKKLKEQKIADKFHEGIYLNALNSFMVKNLTPPFRHPSRYAVLPE